MTTLYIEMIFKTYYKEGADEIMANSSAGIRILKPGWRRNAERG